jgi:hypothetical protein
MKKHLALLLIFLGTACAPVPEPTPTAVPTPTVIPTPTQIPLSQLDIESLLVMDGDLPEHLTPDTITNENAVGSVEELDRADVVYTQYFLLDGGEGGGVSVFLFESLDDVQAAFDKVGTLMDSPSASEAIGEQTLAESFFIPVVPDVPAIEGSRLAFSRCHALAVIQFPRAEDMLAIARYGQLLDGRLQPLVCGDS